MTVVNHEDASQAVSCRSLPPLVLEAIGGGLSSATDVRSASLVCKSWRDNVSHGVHALSLDMHPDPQHWGTRLQHTASAMRGLRSATVYINNNVPTRLLTRNIESMREQLSSLEELNIRLSDSYELTAEAARTLGSLTQLRSLSLVGGALAAEAAQELLAGLAQCRGLIKLVVLPGTRGGLGDDEMVTLSQIHSLNDLEFRAHRLTSRGVQALSLLQHIRRLAISSLEADMGYELSGLARMASLQHLDLALDQGGGSTGGGPLGPLAPLGNNSSNNNDSSSNNAGPVHVAEGAPTLASDDTSGSNCGAVGSPLLALHFKWTDRAAGLLRACRTQLGESLTALDMGACRVSSAAVFSALAELTALKQLQMSMYCNNDTQVLCELSQFSRIAALRTLQLVKKAAYFPEHRAFRASTVSVPITPAAMSVLSQSWGSTLTELHLSLTRQDFAPDGLHALRSFSCLRSLTIHVEGPQPLHSLATQLWQAYDDADGDGDGDGTQPDNVDRAGQHEPHQGSAGSTATTMVVAGGSMGALSLDDADDMFGMQAAEGDVDTGSADIHSSGAGGPDSGTDVRTCGVGNISNSAGSSSGEASNDTATVQTSGDEGDRQRSMAWTIPNPANALPPRHPALLSHSAPIGATALPGASEGHVASGAHAFRAPHSPGGRFHHPVGSPGSRSRWGWPTPALGPGLLSLPPGVVTLDLTLDLPPGLTRLELAGVHVLTPPPPPPRAFGRTTLATTGLTCSSGSTPSLPSTAAAALTPARSTPHSPYPVRPTSQSTPYLLPPLEILSLEACALHSKQLAQLAAGLAPHLAALQLVNLTGLNNAGVAALGALTRLTSLIVFAPGNAQVSQAGAAALSRLEGLKHLSWESDDLSNQGPVPRVFAPFTSLRMLSLSCTYEQVARAVRGNLSSLVGPYCCLDVVGGIPDDAGQQQRDHGDVHHGQ